MTAPAYVDRIRDLLTELAETGTDEQILALASKIVGKMPGEPETVYQLAGDKAGPALLEQRLDRVVALAARQPAPPASEKTLNEFERRFRAQTAGSKMTPAQIEHGVHAIRDAGRRSVGAAAGVAVDIGRAHGLEIV